MRNELGPSRSEQGVSSGQPQAKEVYHWLDYLTRSFLGHNISLSIPKSMMQSILQSSPQAQNTNDTWQLTRQR